MYALLSENMQNHYPVDALNSALATAESDGNTMEKIQVTNQVVEENSAVLETAVSWKVAGSLFTSTPRIFMVYENGQWKLDSLVLRPSDT